MQVHIYISRILLELLEYGKWWLPPSPRLASPPPSHHRFLSNETKLRETAHADISKPPRATAPPAIVTQHRSPHARA